MKLLTTFSICIFVSLIGLPTVGTTLDLEAYLHVAEGSSVSMGRGLTYFEKLTKAAAQRGSVSIGRGLTVTNDELETARTEEFSVGFQLTSALRFSVPFSNYVVDTRGGSTDVLPFGMLNVETVGMMLMLSGRGKLAPFIGIGTNFYDFTEQFATPANIQNTFGAEASAGLNIRLIDNIFEVAQLNGSLGYQFSFLKPKVSVPARPDIEALSLNRHSITFRLEILGL